ncbi:FAD-dependent oxidoreductase [Cellulomonas hominis]
MTRSRRTPRSVVVVGAGLAGAQSVVALRHAGFDGRLTLIGTESLAPYDRPPLSKHLLDRTSPTWLSDELGVDALALADDVRRGTTATGLTVLEDEAVVTLAGDAAPDARVTVTADAVVLATGAHAVRPTGWDAALTLHTARDAGALRARLRPGARLVVVGAGWIGAEVAGVAAAAGVHVTVVEADPTPLRAALGDRVGGLTAPWYADAGVELRTGAPVAQVHTDGVRLLDGTELAADVVLAAVGARPSTGWLAGALPLRPDGSVAVDATWAPLDGPRHVRAVGDLALRWSPRHGGVPGGHWDGALRGPAVAMHDLLLGPDTLVPAGGAVPDPADVAWAAAEDPAPYVFSTQLGHELALYGRHRPGDDVVLRGAPADPGTPVAHGAPTGWTALWFTAGSDELTAVLAVDRPRDVAAARRLFAARHLPRLDRDAAADPEQPLRDALLG